MKKTISTIIVVVLISICSNPLFAYDKELKELLSTKALKRIESAEKLISKGDAYIAETKTLEEEIDALKNADGRIKTGKINKRNKKVAQIKTKASLYYKDGYKKYIDVLDDRLRELEKSGNSQAKQVRDDIKDLEKKARKQYNKAENLSSPDKVIELLELAQSNQEKAIELQSKCLINLNEVIDVAPALIAEEPVLSDSIAVEPIVEEELAEATTLPQDSTQSIVEQVVETPLNTPIPTSVPATAAPVALVTTSAIAATDSLNIDEPVLTEAVEPSQEEVAIIEETPIVEESIASNPDIFLTIQFMADKKQASDVQISNLYNGSKEVIEININDWFKYSVGKYQNLDKAKADMKAENIKGFIVAYNKNQRISVKEAVTLLNGES